MGSAATRDNGARGRKRRGGSTKGLGQQAYEALCEAIQQGVFAPGQRLLEADICEWLHISRTPVREALRRLQAKGLLEHIPRGGVAVCLHDLRAVRELYSFRETLEGTAASLAAQNADETEIGLLQALVRSQRQLPDDPIVHARENKVFHTHLYQAAHNRFLLRSLEVLHESIALLGSTTLALPGRIESGIREHEEIVAAIAAHDPERAGEASRKHIRSSYEARVRLITENVNAAQHPFAAFPHQNRARRLPPRGDQNPALQASGPATIET